MMKLFEGRGKTSTERAAELWASLDDHAKAQIRSEARERFGLKPELFGDGSDMVLSACRVLLKQRIEGA